LNAVLVILALAITPEVNATETGIVAAVNVERAKAGLKPVTLDDGLMESARKHGIWMAEKGRLRHSDNVNEIIAWGQENPERAVEDWMSSRGHRAAIMDAKYTKIGVGAYVKKGKRPYWICQFE
jgi:uncharacterized protein YkwD